jgi:sugar lactone lactonase YvrE
MADPRYTLEQVAEFEHQVTGVSVAEDGRVFVNFPRWSEDTELSVAELLGDGRLRPYPDAEWNAWRNAKQNEISPEDHWVCVQSVVCDWRGNLWVLDPAAPATAAVIPKGPKLVQIDLATNRVVRSFAFDESIAPQGTYLNDVRFSPDGQYAYITNSGPKGSLIVVNVKEGSAWRVLDGHPTTQPEKDVVVHTDGTPLRRPDGRGAQFAADGIALSRDGQWLYWQALTGKTLYRLPTRILHDPNAGDDVIAKQVERVGENGVSDGLWIDAEGRMYISALEDNAVKRREGDVVRTLVRDERLRWPDTFSEGPDETIYVTASHIQDMPWYVPGNDAAVRTQLFWIKPA